MRIWFVAAGTGGHIFPGIALADEIKKTHPQAEILFFGAKDRLESTLVPKAGYPLKTLSAAPWKGKNPLSRLLGLFSLVTGFFQVWGLLKKSKPEVLVSVGGYVSVPTALACRCFGVPLVILEPNIRAGLANRLLSSLAVRAFCTPGADSLTKLHCPVVDAGNPLRDDLRPVPLREHVKTILVLGGSQGALSLCQASLAAARDLKLEQRQVRLILQCGAKNLEASQKWQKDFGVESATEIKPFIEKVPEALAAADIVIARAGAMTVAELAVAGLPTIFVPFPFAADDHQRVNAKILADQQAAYMIDERDGNLELMLVERIEDLAFKPHNAQLRVEFSKNFKLQGRPHATADIAKQILSLCHGRG